ncbi:uncharacterized protein LOC131633504 [Vicia villosa]|uniref:uncharacterized protein LOC131633504 n=1 Tax=Vicia villosa TaxID=3911 RepID=UPI00273C0BA8|nr:uncharacterized protein LOC131633504 [Vicia villosa]
MGMSGGLITFWKVGGVKVLSSFKGEGYLGIKVVWKGDLFYLVNIYSSCDFVKKKRMWEILLDLKEKLNNGEWIMGGDFNVIKDRMERKGRSTIVHYKDLDSFSEFIQKSASVDIPCKGKMFSWYSGDEKSMSRIDRFLVFDNVVSRWGVVGQLIEDRDISDHSPVWIVSDVTNWGPKPFKFNNEWFSLESFMPFGENEWKKIKLEGKGDFVLKEKLRLFKDKLRRWNKEVFGRIDLEVEEGVRDLNLADAHLEMEDGILFSDTLERRKEASSHIWRNMRLKENMLLQKSRLKWIKEGDDNSSFFTRC